MTVGVHFLGSIRGWRGIRCDLPLLSDEIFKAIFDSKVETTHTFILFDAISAITLLSRSEWGWRRRNCSVSLVAILIIIVGLVFLTHQSKLIQDSGQVV